LAFDCSHSLTPPRKTESRKILSTIGDISYRTKWLVSKRYMQAAIVITLMTLAIAVPLFTRAFALTDVGNAGVFELDGNIVKDSSGTFPTDWGALFDTSGVTQPLPAGALDAHWVNDGPHAVTDLTTFTTGSKDTLDIANAGWQCTPSGNLTPKDDILHSYSLAITPQSGPRMGHLLVYGGFERFTNNGAGDLGLWLLQDPTVACSSTKGAVSFTGAHVVGDILFVGEFSTGGTVTTLNAFEWVGGSSPLMNITATGGADCRTADMTGNFCSRSNTVSISTPWSTQDKTSGPNTLATAEFFEVGIDLTGLFGSNPPCINRFIFDTRTSPSVTATLKDYAEGALATCPTATILTSVSPTPITLGGSATDTATVTLSTASTVDGTVDFKVYGPVATNIPTCNSLAGSFLGVKIGPGVTPQSATSGLFTPSATGFYFWTATYNPATPRNGNTAFTTCGDGGELLVVASIPKITAFGFTNTPDNGDPTLGSGTVVYSVTIHSYDTLDVMLSGSLAVSGTAMVNCGVSNTLTLSGSLAGGADAMFSLTCTYSGISGQNVQATINAMFTDVNSVTGTVSGSPTTYIFTIQKL
ncbi:MAG TPA: hypothetical protein VJL56_05565, partial [Candidatus Bathyarchaeia archaeon]|nr:hypothetical protein [Candidatus Bathyarchaeia archaeon]